MIPQKIDSVPMNIDPALRAFLQSIRNAVVSLQSTVVPPDPISNLKATPKAGGNIIQFTRSNGDAYILYFNTIPQLNGARRIDLGLAAEYTDEIGAEGIKRYYWIKAKKGQTESSFVGPVTATSLALGAAITPPDPPPATQNPIRSDETRNVEVGRPTSSTYEKV
jgi:hypothetical protein